jgi:hypothetical protein
MSKILDILYGQRQPQPVSDVPKTLKTPAICNLYSLELSAFNTFKFGIEHILTRRFTFKSNFVLDSTHGASEVSVGVRFYPIPSPVYPQGEFVSVHGGANLTEKFLLGVGVGKKVYLAGGNDRFSSSRPILTCMLGLNGSPYTYQLSPIISAGIGIEI